MFAFLGGRGESVCLKRKKKGVLIFLSSCKCFCSVLSVLLVAYSVFSKRFGGGFSSLKRKEEKSN